MNRVHSIARTSPCLLILPILLFLGCSTNTENPSYVNAFDPTLGENLPVPDSVTVMVGDNVVKLAWKIPTGQSADEYAIFRKTLNLQSELNERLVGRVSKREYTDLAVSNGRHYVYRIAAGANGQFGTRTTEVDATPGLYSLLLAGGAPFTQNRLLSITFNAPTAQVVRIAEDPDSFTTAWQNVNGVVQWTLSAGDGMKTVYAQFRFSDGSMSVPAFGKIRLDTQAVIQSVSFDGASVRRPGETVHFRLVAGEPNGLATINVDGIFSGTALFDNGTGGDRVAGDGVYERDLVIPPAASVHDTPVTGSFADEAGNVAAQVSAPELLTVERGPDAVTLTTAEVSEPPDAPFVTLNWSESLDAQFQGYAIYRAEAADVDSLSRLVGTITSAAILTQQDTDVIEGHTYYYRVYVRNNLGLETGSNIVQAQVTNLRPPAAVTLQQPTSIGVTSVGLEWSQSGDRDFGSYRVYRNETGAVTESDDLVTEITDVGRAFCDDVGLQSNTIYYYRVYVLDQGGLKSRSNEIQVTTRQPEQPDPVNLATPIVADPPDPASATLNWSRSQDADFAAYRIFRAESLPVDTLSRLMATVDNVATLSYQDSAVAEGETYYYRVYVQDSAGHETGSNTVQAFIENLRPPTAVTLETPDAIGTTRIGLDWSRSPDLDFGSYRIYRNTTGDVTDGDQLIAEISDISRIFYDDEGLQQNTKYYYRIYTLDQGGLKARSNEVSATTQSAAP